MSEITEGIEDKNAKINEAFCLLLEARDALPAISLSAALRHGVSLTLADRIEQWLEPWKLTGDNNPAESEGGGANL